MRIKRSGAIVVLLENDRFVFHDFLGQQTFLANTIALEIIRRLPVWTDLEGVLAFLTGYSRDSIVRAVRQLIELGAILEEGTPAAALDDDFTQRWLWGPLAGAYHFGARDGTFLAAEAADALLTAQAKYLPSPPLFTRNRDPASDVVLPMGAYESELFSTMARRRTQRFLLDAPIALEHLADCLLFSMAITGIIEDPQIADLPLKMTPSGGGRNPYESYVCARAVDGLEPGAYHYSGWDRTLGVVRAGPPPAFPDLLAGQAWTADAAAVIFLVANFERPMWKYHDPGAYRVTMIEAGHIAQNIMLVATKYGLAANPSGALTRSLVEETLGVGGVTQSVVYALVLGVPAEPVEAPG
jgi:SagB-type dehydrogenase family enzyme